MPKELSDYLRDRIKALKLERKQLKEENKRLHGEVSRAFGRGAEAMKHIMFLAKRLEHDWTKDLAEEEQWLKEQERWQKI